MEIKKADQSSVNQIASETIANSDTTSAQKTSAGIGSVKDSFAAHQADSLSGMTASPASAAAKLATQLTASKAEITGYLTGKATLGGSSPKGDLWAVMSSYLSSVQKEVRDNASISQNWKMSAVESQKSQVENSYDHAMKQIEKNKEASEGSSNPLFGTIIGGPIVGTLIGNPVEGAPAESSNGQGIDELKDHARKIKEQIAQDAQVESAGDVDGRYQSLISWLDDRKK